MKKQAMAWLLSAAMLLSISGMAVGAADQWLYGDVDRNGDVDSSDARLALQSSVSKVDLDEVQAILADVDDNQTIDSSDARMMLQFAVQKLDGFPAGDYYTVPGEDPKPSVKPIYPEETTPNDDPDTWATYTAGNPVFTNIFTADPSAHVWEDGRLYVYASHDIFPSQGCDLMDKYHVFSTDNMVDWVDHGEILSSDDVEWGRPEGGFMWAPDCAYKDGTYYFFYPHPSETDWGNSWKIGVATSDKPASDFEDQGYITGLPSKDLIDPCVFQDDDGQFYISVGGGGKCYIGKLSDDMMSVVDGTLRELDELEDFHEASWLFKRNGLYYLMYADGNSGANNMRYATAESLDDIWTNRGILLEPVLDCETTHGSVVQYRGNWYLFYHNAAISGNGTLRSVCVDALEFNEDGTIKMVQQTETSVPAVGPASESTEHNGSLIVDESSYDKYTVTTEYAVKAENAGGGAGFKDGIIENLHVSGSYVDFTGVDGGKGGKALITLTYSSGGQNGSTMKVDASGDTAGDGYFMRVPKTTGWGDYSGKAYCLVDLLPGTDNVIRLNGGMGGVNVRSLMVSLLPQE